MSRKLRAVFFDLGETLVTQNIEDNLVTKKALSNIAQTLPEQKSPEVLYRTYQQGYKANEAIRSKHHVEIPVQTWMRQLLTHVLRNEPSENLVSKAIKVIVTLRASNAVAFDDAKPSLALLRKRGVKLGIISNVSSHEVAVQILKNVQLYNYFDQVVTSALAGIRKPDPGIFLYALQQFEIDPRKAVHVGDSEHHDVEGAKPVGIRTVLVSRRHRKPATIADHFFGNLEEASRLLASSQVNHNQHSCDSQE